MPASLASALMRRRFLHGSAVGATVSLIAGRSTGQEAAGRPMPQTEVSPPLPESERVGFAVLGLGKFALNQIVPSFGKAKQARLAALVSGPREKAAAVGKAYGVGEGHLYGYHDFERMTDDPDVQVVYVITPNALHEEFTLRALRAGKHVLCEKPMAPTAAACERMIAAARDAGKKLMIAQRAQYEPYNMTAIELCRRGDLGPLKLVTSDHGRQLDPADPADQWRMSRALAGGGSLVDIGIYSLQAARYLTGEEPVEVRGLVQSTAGDGRFREVEESCLFQLRFPSGALASCSSSYGQADVKRIQAMGARATLELDPATDYYERRMWLRTKAEQRELKLEDENQFALELDHMAECVRTGAEPKTPGEEGLRDVRIIEAIYASAKDGGAPLQL